MGTLLCGNFDDGVNIDVKIFIKNHSMFFDKTYITLYIKINENANI